MAEQPKQPSWAESMLQPLFDRLGLNGIEGMRRIQPKPAKPEHKSLTDKQLKAMGYSDSDIAAVRKWEASQNQ